ncbi:hypothetical protein BU26DRAFT_603703 [Trematosphaeria pertusa]|uniref:Uncharacterized protein n=1 Tax=Trematosphaeria pertusa TaxID=390896 RepID=A0A6A6IKV8_9PLEO|nr:uncharacterized protein BU26DRAFT_603703 [Trematosphaeria pertusa]KAF2251244.1 hypothetical protein BU26DRAFT_603703 [Trematosphaeria pertusa]
MPPSDTLSWKVILASGIFLYALSTTLYNMVAEPDYERIIANIKDKARTVFPQHRAFVVKTKRVQRRSRAGYDDRDPWVAGLSVRGGEGRPLRESEECAGREAAMRDLERWVEAEVRRRSVSGGGRVERVGG